MKAGAWRRNTSEKMSVSVYHVRDVCDVYDYCNIRLAGMSKALSARFLHSKLLLSFIITFLGHKYSFEGRCFKNVLPIF